MPRCTQKARAHTHARTRRRAWPRERRVNTRSREYVYVCACVRACVRALRGGSSHTSSGGSPSHVLRGENVPPACRKGR